VRTHEVISQVGWSRLTPGMARAGAAVVPTHTSLHVCTLCSCTTNLCSSLAPTSPRLPWSVDERDRFRGHHQRGGVENTGRAAHVPKAKASTWVPLAHQASGTSHQPWTALIPRDAVRLAPACQLTTPALCCPRTASFCLALAIHPQTKLQTRIFIFRDDVIKRGHVQKYVPYLGFIFVKTQVAA
jgi:hypothetical protein